MSDAHFDALRAAGEYPPKGYGLLPREEQRKLVEAALQRGEKWAEAEARWLNVPTQRSLNPPRRDDGSSQYLTAQECACHDVERIPTDAEEATRKCDVCGLPIIV